MRWAGLYQDRPRLLRFIGLWGHPNEGLQPASFFLARNKGVEV